MRVQAVFRPGDYPGEPDDATRAGLADLFGQMFPGQPEPEIDENHAGIAIAALNPAMAKQLAGLSRMLALDAEWSKRTDLRELAIQTVNLHYRSDYSWRTRLPLADAAGLSRDQLAAIPFWRGTPLFDDDQRLTVEYSFAVLSGSVPDALFDRVKRCFGDKGAVEFTSVIGLWSMWAMLLNAVRPDDAPVAG